MQLPHYSHAPVILSPELGNRIQYEPPPIHILVFMADGIGVQVAGERFGAKDPPSSPQQFSGFFLSSEEMRDRP